MLKLDLKPRSYTWEFLPVEGLNLFRFGHGDLPLVVTRYLVTGCAGFIGSHLTETLLKRGHEVIGVDAFTDYYHRRGRSPTSRRPVGSWVSPSRSWTSPSPLEPLFDGVDGVFHLAAQPGVRVGGDLCALRPRQHPRDPTTLRGRGAQGLRIVMASTSSVYGDAETYPTREDTSPRPVSPYGVTKVACEFLARTYSECFGLEVVVLRYFTVYGPRQRPDMAFARIISALLDRHPFPVYGTGEQSRDFTYVDDAVAATIAAMEGGPSMIVYNVGGAARRR